MAAAFGGHAGVATAQLERGAKVEAAEKKGLTAYRLAEQNGHERSLGDLKRAMETPLQDEDYDL